MKQGKMEKFKVFIFFFLVILLIFFSITASIKMDENMLKEGEKFKQDIVNSYDASTNSFKHKREIVQRETRYEIILNGDKIVFDYNYLAGKGKYGTSKFMQVRKNGDLIEWYCGGTLNFTNKCE